MISLAIAYQTNNDKLRKLIKRYKIRRNLKRRVLQVTKKIDEWSAIDKGKFQSRKLESDEESPNMDFELIQQFKQHDVSQSRSLVNRLSAYLEMHQNKFLFQSVDSTLNFLIQQNHKVLTFRDEDMKIDTILGGENVHLMQKYLIYFYNEVQNQIRKYDVQGLPKSKTISDIQELPFSKFLLESINTNYKK